MNKLTHLKKDTINISPNASKIKICVSKILIITTFTLTGFIQTGENKD